MPRVLNPTQGDAVTAGCEYHIGDRAHKLLMALGMVMLIVTTVLLGNVGLEGQAMFGASHVVINGASIPSTEFGIFQPHFLLLVCSGVSSFSGSYACHFPSTLGWERVGARVSLLTPPFKWSRSLFTPPHSRSFFSLANFSQCSSNMIPASRTASSSIFLL